MTTITTENVKFNGTLSNSAVLASGGGSKTLILTDALSAADRATLDAFVAKYGSNPLSAATAGSKAVTFSVAPVGANATGLSAVASATAGAAVVGVGGAVTGSSATGLAIAAGSAGTQTVELLPGVLTSTATGLFGGTAATAGRQSYSWTGLVGASATGLPNTGTTFTATIVVDGVTKSVSLAGSAAQTFTTLISGINTALGAAGTAAIISPTEFRVTSATTGASSSVAITDTGLFAALTGVGTKAAAVAGVALVAATTYTVAMTVDGVSTPLSIVGSSALTYATLVSAINTGLSTAGSVALTGGDLVFTSATTGATSKVRLNSGTLFPALTAYVSVLPPRDGTTNGHKYSATITIDGVIKSVLVSGASVQTYTLLLAAINTAIGAAGTAAIVSGNLKITSATTGLASSVKIYDTGLFASLTGYTGFTLTAGTAPTQYTASIVVDGVAKPVSVQGSAVLTFTLLLAAINTALGSAGTAAISGSTITVTSATTGTASTVRIIDGNLFSSLAGYKGHQEAVDGITDLVAAMKAVKVGSASLYDEFKVVVVGAKPALPAVPAALPKTLAFTYWNGSVWKYLVDDSNV